MSECVCVCESPSQYFNANALNTALDLLRVLHVAFACISIVDGGSYCS